MKMEAFKNSVKYLFMGTVFLLCLNSLIHFAITPKPWYEGFYITVLSALTGVGIGGILGLITGGIWVILISPMGIVFGFLGAVSFGIVGLGIGALGGSLYTIASNPENYDINRLLLGLIIVISAFISWSIYRLLSIVIRPLFAYIEGERGIRKSGNFCTVEKAPDKHMESDAAELQGTEDPDRSG